MGLFNFLFGKPKKKRVRKKTVATWQSVKNGKAVFKRSKSKPKGDWVKLTKYDRVF